MVAIIGIVHGKRVTCPLHNLVIELENGHAMAPDVGCAVTFNTRMEQDVIYLELDPGKMA